MPSEYKAKLGYEVDTRPLKKGEKALDDITRAGKRTESGISGLSNTVGLLSTAIGALAASSVVNGVIKYSDSWNRVDNQLKIVITSESELIRKRQELLELSKDTNAQLDSTVALYAELYRNTRELNTSDSELMSVTATLNNLFVAGAKDAQTQAGAIRQLSQALGTGALRGDEFISVTEAAPRVMDALAQSLGIAKGELRDFAATGGITSEVLVNALSAYSDEAQRLADRTTKTFDQYAQNAESNLTAYVGSSKGLLDATTALGTTLESVSENIDGVVNGVSAIAAVTTAAAIPSAVKYTASIITNTQAQLLANTQSIRTVSALGQVSVAAGTATVATNALGIATKFLLGPWGLLLTAVSAAGIAYSTTSSNASIMNDELKNQKDAIDDLTGAYKFAAKARIGLEAVNARARLSEIEMEKRSVVSGIVDPSNIAEMVRARKKIDELDDEAKDLKVTVDAANKAFNSSLPSDWIDGLSSNSNSSKISDQSKALSILRKEVGLTSDQLFVFRQEQKSIAKGDTTEATAAIVKQAEDIIKARNKVKKEEEDFKDLISGTDTVDLFALGESKKYDEWIESIYTSVTSRSELIENEMGDIWDAMLGNDIDWDVGVDRIAQLQDELDSLSTPKDIGFDIIASGATDSLKAMQSLSAQGSKEYRKLGVAIEAVNAIQAVGAVLNQAGGDPYTAFARMAAMAASVASLGYSVGSIAGGLADESADNQANQGLNVWGDKSESIANATDVTANAVEKLVGINSDMLKALQSVQNGISKAAAIVGRDVTTPTINQDKLKFDYSDVMGIFEPLGFEKLIFDPLGIFGKTFNKLFGGSSKVVDEGIRIIGGSLGEMMDDITVLAFQSVKYKKWKFGSTKRKTQYKDITDDVGSQFQLILNSIADSVFLGATGLGLDSTSVEKAIQDFKIESFNISLKGLSAEDQQAEIEAVFGKIFDDLSGEIVPFLDKFQQVGEGLGETLARVSTQVSIMDLMVDQLGVTMFDKMANPEMYAQAADNISTLVGGIEEFADKTSGFVNNFATEATKIDIYQKSLTDSFNEVGLTLPGTAAGMWDLMASLDGSTEAGQEQIAMLLNSQEQAAAYFNLIEKTTKGYRDAIDAMYGVSDAVAQMSLDAALAAARMGDFSLAEQLSTNSLAPSMSSFGSRSEYELARAQTAAKLEELAQLTEGTISVDEKQLTTLEQIRDTIKDNGTIENTAAISELKKEVQAMNAVQVGQARNVADSNALLQQIVIDGIPVRVEE